MMTFRFAEEGDDALLRFLHRFDSTPYAGFPKLPSALPYDGPYDNFPVRKRKLVAEQNSEIRAIQNFFEHELFVDGCAHPFVWPTEPLSEALLDPKYASLWLAMLRHSLSLQPLHLVLGAFRPGDAPALGPVFTALRWRSEEVPAFAYPINLGRIARQSTWLRRRRSLAIAAWCAGYTGIGTAASLVLRVRRVLANGSDISAEEVPDFGEWADVIWQRARLSYRALTRRDAATLNRLYLPGDSRVRRWRIRRRERDLGWLLVVVRSFVDDPVFGSLRLAVLVDGLCEPSDVADTLALGLREAVRSGADLCVAWWTDRVWQDACRRLGFLRIAPGDMTLYVSPAGKSLLLTPDLPLESCHFSRGDCDGPGRFMPARASVSQGSSYDCAAL
jgi:hypothetical protein